MSVFGQLVATYIIGNEKAVFCVWALAPAVLCTCCCSAFRGYAQGHMNMMPTAISQIIEALCKLFLGLGLAMVIMSLTLWPEDIRNRLAASGALIGVSFGSVLSVIYLAFNHFRTRRGSAARAADQPDRSRVVLARLLKPVSYTHLDVYKRQPPCGRATPCRSPGRCTPAWAFSQSCPACR